MMNHFFAPIYWQLSRCDWTDPSKWWNRFDRESTGKDGPSLGSSTGQKHYQKRKVSTETATLQYNCIAVWRPKSSLVNTVLKKLFSMEPVTNQKHFKSIYDFSIVDTQVDTSTTCHDTSVMWNNGCRFTRWLNLTEHWNTSETRWNALLLPTL